MQSHVFRLCLEMRSGVAGSLIRRMIYAVVPADWLIIPWVHALNAAHVHAVFVWVRAALVMGVDPANTTEEVLCGMRSKRITRQLRCSFEDLEIAAGHARGRGSPPFAIAAVTPSCSLHTVLEPDNQFDCATMAGDLDPVRHFRRTDGTRVRDSWYLASGCGGWPSVRVQNCGPPRRSQSGVVSTNPMTKPPTCAQ